MYKQFNKESRIALATLLRVGHTPLRCAQELGFNKSSVTRETSINKDGDGVYRGSSAHAKYLTRRKKAKRSGRKIKCDIELQKHIEARLFMHDSPEQIAGRLVLKKKVITLCHETIYQWIFNERPDLKTHLRRIGHKGKYCRRRGTKAREKEREEAKIQRIDTRPTIVEKRVRLGDFEEDTILGSPTVNRFVTNVDRFSEYGLLDMVLGANSKKIRAILEHRFRRIPKEKRHTYTYDNGTEIGKEDKDLGKMIGMKGYRAYPYHSWERGTNENYNGLVRDFFSKGTNFTTITKKEVKRVERILNHRPRKRLGYLTPHEVFVLGMVPGAVQTRM